jgi:hypothetical protein
MFGQYDRFGACNSQLRGRKEYALAYYKHSKYSLSPITPYSTSPSMYMHDKLLKARGIIYTIGLAVAVVIVVWEHIVR